MNRLINAGHKFALFLRRVARVLPKLIQGDITTWRRFRLELASRTAHIWGDFPVYDDYKMWRADKVFLNKFNELSPGNRFSDERKYMVREFARYVSNKQGAIAECGSYEGASAYFLAQANPDTSVHLFDSFEGLSEPTESDLWSHTKGSYWKKGDMTSTLEKLLSNLQEFENIVIHKGWIPEVFSDCNEPNFKLVHIDVDLYEPTLASLNYFYPRLIEGGIIVMDDYGYFTCPGAYKAANDFASSHNIKIIHLTTGQGIILKINQGDTTS